MKSPITVCEFAKLVTADIVNSPDCASISASAFKWLCEQQDQLAEGAASFVRVTRMGELRLGSYVGVIETPCGTVIEVLPKHLQGTDDIETCRRTLRRMLLRVLDLNPRKAAEAELQIFDGPLTEWIAARFLAELERLVSRGIRFDYHRVEDEQRFLRGRLDLARQLRLPLGRRHIFNVKHDEYVPDRAENRLLHSALDLVRRRTREPRNWQLAHELASFLAPIPLSLNYSRDFRDWKTDRLMAHYSEIRPWCSLILNEQVPLSMVGSWSGPSLLFPMEKVFEGYVAACLRDGLLPGARLTRGARTQHLCDHRSAKWFWLEPDLLLESGEQRWILDAKWKLLDASLGDSENKYMLSQADFYQMFVYGQKYLGGRGDMVLIYPKTRKLQIPLEPFYFSKDLRLWVVPFDLDSGCFVKQLTGLPLRLPSSSVDRVSDMPLFGYAAESESQTVLLSA